jgi:PEGA domain
MRGLVLAFVVGMALPAAAKTPLVSGPAPGTLVINSTTTGAEVFVDGNRLGMIPLPGAVPMAPGEHTIKVVKPGFAPLIDVFTISKKKQTVVEAELAPVAGVLIVTANVEKAHVFIDGKFMGEAPMTTELQVGARAVQVSKGGYKDFFQNVSAVAGQDITLDIKLEELPAELNPYKPPPPPPARWYEKWWVWTAAAGGVAAVVAITLGVVLTRPGDPCESALRCYTPTLH